MAPRRIYSYLYLVVLICLSGLSIRNLLLHPAFETNILGLLPAIYRDKAVESILSAQSTSLSSRVVVVTEAPTAGEAERTAKTVAEKMRASALFQSVEDSASSERLRALQTQFLKNPFGLVPPSGDLNHTLQSARSQAFSPLGVELLQHVERDPLLLFPAYLARTVGLGNRFTVQNGFIHADTQSSSNVVITATLHAGGIAQASAGTVTEFFDSLPSYAPATVSPAGVVFFAEESATKTKREVSRISSLTFVAVIAFLLWVFRSLLVVALISLCVTTSFLGTLYLSQNLWIALFGGGLHLITVGFGSSLLGISPDYAIHFFVAHRASTSSDRLAPIRKITPALLLGYLAAIIGFLGIALSPFPGLQQLALFSYVGLTLALLTTLYLLPKLSGRPRFDERLVQMARLTSSEMFFRLRRILLFVSAALVILGVPRLQVIDDIRALSKPSNRLIQRQQKAAQLVGYSEGSSLVIVQGRNEEEVLQREEALVPLLTRLIQTGKLQSYRALSSVVPSKLTQSKNYASYSKLLSEHRDALDLFTSDLALPQGSVKTLESVVSNTLLSPPLELRECLSSPACDSVKDLWSGSDSGTIASIVTLTGFTGDVSDTFRGYQGVTGVNQADSISAALRRYRLSATRYTALFYGILFIILTLRYGIRHSWRLCLPPCIGAATALGALGVCGVPINVFSVFAILVLVGLSIDYAIFNAEKEGDDHALGSFAVLVSAVTTTISFGLLSLSSVPALVSFGIVLSIGVMVAALVAPAARRL